MRARLREEEGIALMVASVVVTVLMLVGLAGFAYVDDQDRESNESRVKESAFSLGEGALTAQIFTLSRNWPGTAVSAYPTSCGPGASSLGCPDTANLRENFGEIDPAEAIWQTSVRDNGGSAVNFYSEDITASQPTWDANADGRLWVRSQGATRGERRSMVALVKVEEVIEEFPRNALTAGHFATGNNGRKVIVDSKGPSAQPAPLAVRCAQRSPPCLDYQADKGQVWPDTTQVGYAGPDGLTPEAIDRFRARAIANGAYHSTCPANPSGLVVVVESGDCSYSNSTGACCNSLAAPGLFMVLNGTVSFNGNITFYGIVYMPNRQRSTGNVVAVGGTAAIQGAVAIDGDGTLAPGSSKTNIVYDERVFSALRSYGSAGIIQNTWREIR